MAVETAAAPAEAAVSAPAAAPSAAPASAPSTESVAAPAAAPVVTDIGENEATTSFLTRAMDAQKKAEVKPPDAVAAPAEPEKTDPPAVDPLADPAKVEADKKAAEDKEIADKAAAELAAKTGEAVDEEEFELNPVGPLPPRDLAQKLKENPALAAELEKSGLKDSIFAASRLASRVAGYEAVFPDVEAAKYAAEVASDFGNLADAFTGIKDMDTATGFMRALMPFSYVLDEDGKPQLDPQGQPVNDGSVGRFMDNTLGLVLKYQEEQAKKDGDEDFLAAIDLLKARTGRGPASAVEEQLTEDQKKEDARLKSERESITREKQQANEAKYQEFETNVAKDVESEVDKLVDGILGKADLADFNKKYLKEEIREALYATVKNRKDFFMQLDNLMKRPMSEKVRKERVALALRTIKPLLPNIAREKLNAAGVKLQAKQAEKIDRVAAREQQNRSEQRGSGRPAAPTTPPSDEAIQAEAVKEFVEKYHREPNTSEMLSAFGAKKAKYGVR